MAARIYSSSRDLEWEDGHVWSLYWFEFLIIDELLPELNRGSSNLVFKYTFCWIIDIFSLVKISKDISKKITILIDQN